MSGVFLGPTVGSITPTAETYLVAIFRPSVVGNTIINT